jgi:hypothetical protein
MMDIMRIHVRHWLVGMSLTRRTRATMMQFRLRLGRLWSCSAMGEEARGRYRPEVRYVGLELETKHFGYVRYYASHSVGLLSSLKTITVDVQCFLSSDARD